MSLRRKVLLGCLTGIVIFVVAVWAVAPKAPVSDILGALVLLLIGISFALIVISKRARFSARTKENALYSGFLVYVLGASLGVALAFRSDLLVRIWACLARIGG